MASDDVQVILTYDGQDIQHDDGILLELIEGGPDFPALQRGQDTVAPHRPGRVSRNRVADRRIIELRGRILGATEDAFWQNRMTLGALFDGSRKALVATLPGGDTWSIVARLNPPPFIVQETPTFARVALELESIDPDWELDESS